MSSRIFRPFSDHITAPQASEIGYSLAISGAAAGGLQLFFMPYLLRRFDHAKMYNFCMAIWPYCYVLLPGLNLIARMGVVDEATGQIDPSTKALLWIGIGGILLLARSACLAFSYVSLIRCNSSKYSPQLFTPFPCHCHDRVSMILVKDSAPDPSSLGATNGLAQFAMVRPRRTYYRVPAFHAFLYSFYPLHLHQLSTAY